MVQTQIQKVSQGTGRSRHTVNPDESRQGQLQKSKTEKQGQSHTQ